MMMYFWGENAMTTLITTTTTTLVLSFTYFSHGALGEKMSAIECAVNYLLLLDDLSRLCTSAESARTGL